MLKYFLMKNNQKQPSEFPTDYLESNEPFSYYNYNIIDEEKTRLMVQDFETQSLEDLKAKGYKVTNRLVTGVLNKLKENDMGILMDKDQEKIALITVWEGFKPDEYKQKKTI